MSSYRECYFDASNGESPTSSVRFSHSTVLARPFPRHEGIEGKAAIDAFLGDKTLKTNNAMQALNCLERFEGLDPHPEGV
ncbi:hypothetical protein LshimejAT787_0801400 [Lyophyllum shimeji]|uniref:Uncharacterized protein n=1 Tax=Lyophyllum shimeji TaxID=47721 RepID=A0A9P3UMB9_LYOSH|nr:hypothetical protein LshimejAT787_0801400 [Lyophyllum shimeji]